jgi:hypothetical protein
MQGIRRRCLFWQRCTPFSTGQKLAAPSMLCILLIASIFRRYNARQAYGFAPSPNP